MIEIENLSVAFDGTEVVKQVTFKIEDGEILGVVGESGSGEISFTHEIVKSRGIITIFIIKDAIDLFFMI